MSCVLICCLLYYFFLLSKEKCKRRHSKIKGRKGSSSDLFPPSFCNWVSKAIKKQNKNDLVSRSGRVRRSKALIEFDFHFTSWVFFFFFFFPFFSHVYWFIGNFCVLAFFNFVQMCSIVSILKLRIFHFFFLFVDTLFILAEG